MSIAGSIFGEFGNEKKRKWTNRFRAVLEDKHTNESEKLQMISDIISDMEEFEFSE